MAETVKMLSPQKTVFLAKPIAGCPMADQMDAELISQMKEDMPGYKVTSSSAVKIIRNIPNDKYCLSPIAIWAIGWPSKYREKRSSRYGAAVLHIYE